MKNAHCQILSRQWALGLARSGNPYMGGPPLPGEQGMDMPHIIIREWLSGLPKRVFFVRVFITFMSSNISLDGNTTMWYVSI